VHESLTVELPPCLLTLWEFFKELNGRRPAAMGMSPISNQELESWQRNHGVVLTPWEIDTIFAMDTAAMAVVAERQANARRID
jgi:hypothetical protein